MENEDNPDTAEVQSQDIDSSKVTETATTGPEQDQEEEVTETGIGSLAASVSKSSPFHGFSSQDEGDKDEENEEVTTSGTGTGSGDAETSNDKGQLKSQLIADFGIGQEVSEEDVDNSEDSEDPVGEKDSVIKNQIIQDFGISQEVSEEDDSENCEIKTNQDDMETNIMETEVSIDTKVSSPELGESNSNEGGVNQDPKEEEEEEGMETEEGNDPDDITESLTPAKKISPLKIGQIKNSPRRVHFSPEVELREQSKEEVLLNVTPKAPKKSSDSSPPLKLKIKFGKDKSGAITHCKINTKPTEEPQSAQEIVRPESDFHGFTEEEIPAWVVDNFEGLDLTSPFDFQPTIYLSISNKKEKQKMVGAPTVEEDVVKSVKIKPVPIEAASFDQQAGSPSPSLSKKERRKKSDNLNFVKPLWDGWYREIVWRPTGVDKKDADVYYYPPNPPGQKKLRYKTTTELEAFLITSGSMYPISFFTFKKELVGGPPGWEVEREVEALEKPPPASVVSPLAETLGKRVSKPPEKLIMETETETPTRTSKRAIKPPDKFDTETFSPASKQPRLEAALTNPAPNKLIKSSPDLADKSSGSGTLKLKNFSKMNAKNQIGGLRAETDGDLMELSEESEPSGASAPGMTITKVKKSGGSNKQGETINLPGLPTTGPAPPSYVSVPGQAPPSSISITPLANNRPGPGPGQGQIMIAPGNVCKKILRPGKSTSLPCSIHCPGTSGFPSLSCTACHCLYHPDCVQVSQASANSPNTEFYCNDCQPPSPNPGNLIPVPPPLHLQKQHHHPPPPSNHGQTKQRKEDQTKGRSQTSSSASKVEEGPVRPFQGQTMINVAGRKFLVIPHPVPESPPPSPPQTNQKQPGGGGGGGGQSSSQNNTNALSKAEKLGLLLKPASGDSSMPCFEVELTPDGKYLLQPKDSTGATARNVFAPENRGSSWGQYFNMNVNFGYTTMIEVFKYLSVKERLAASSVCRMWRDIAVNQSLWRTVSLKNTRIYDWAGFVRFFNQTQSSRLDLRKMMFVKDRDQTWQDMLDVSERFQALRSVELPRVPGPVLTGLVSSWSQLETLHVPLVSPPFNINSLASLSNLREVKLKAVAGSSISITERISDLSKLSGSLTSLSLLGLDGLQASDFDVFGTMLHLKSLELGDCSAAPENFFKTVSELTNLEKLRLEKGHVGENFGKLCSSHRLKQVELIDFKIRQGFRSGLRNLKNIEKFLLIPAYQDEVAEINSEIVEGVTKEMTQLTSLYLGMTNEWLEAMAMTSGAKKTGGEKECFPMMKAGRIEHISLPALYRTICREMPGCKVKVLKMSAQATCKQYIVNLDQTK